MGHGSLPDRAHRAGWIPFVGMAALLVGCLPEWEPFYRDEPDPYETRTEVWIMNSDGSNQRILTIGGSPDWSPDGKRIAFANEGKVWAIDVDGQNLVNLSGDHLTADDGEPDWSPDGTEIAFGRTRTIRVD